MRPGRFQEIDPSFSMKFRSVFLLMIFVGTSVYIITLNICLHPALVLYVFIPIIHLIMVKPKTTTKLNSKKEKDDFYAFGVMAMFLPIGAWANIDMFCIFYIMYYVLGQ